MEPISGLQFIHPVFNYATPSFLHLDNCLQWVVVELQTLVRGVLFNSELGEYCSFK